MRRIVPLLFFFGSTFGLSAQDLHYSMFDMAPLSVNPALTGAYEGTARAGVIYRDQWASFLDEQFRTPTFYVDAPIIQGFRPNDWVGVGINFFSDQAGFSNLQTNGALLSASYHFAVNKDATTYLTLGLQGGRISREIDLMNNNLVFEDELPNQVGGGGLGLGNGADRMGGESANFFDFNAGLMLRSQINESNDLEIGVAAAHIFEPEYGFLSGATGGGGGGDEGGDTRPIRLLVHGQLRNQISTKWSVTPMVLFQHTSGSSEFTIQGLGGYAINDKVDLEFGAGFRFDDAVFVRAGATVTENLRVAASYDINTSSLSDVSNGQGGFELAAWYIFKIFKQPDVDPAIFCPQL